MKHLVGPACAALLVITLTSCTSGTSGTGATPTTPGVVTAQTGAPADATLPPSQLCSALDLATARTVSAALQYVPQTRPAATGSAGPSPAAAAGATACTYASADRTTVLSLAPTSRGYQEEADLAAGVAATPASAQFSQATVTNVPGVGVAAFVENDVTSAGVHVSFLVWRPGDQTSRGWVLTLVGGDTAAGDTSTLVTLATSLTTRLPARPEDPATAG